MYFKRLVTPKSISFFEKLFQIRFSSEAKNIYDAIDYLDDIIFHNYIRRQATEIHKITQYGILFSGLEWHNIRTIQGIHPIINYRHKTLLQSNSVKLCNCSCSSL